MTTAEAVVLAFICDAVNDHGGEFFVAEPVRNDRGVVTRPELVIETRVAGTIRVRVTEEPSSRARADDESGGETS